MESDDWLQPRNALEMLVAEGAQRPEAWHLVADAMRQGRLRCHVASLTTYFVAEPSDQRLDVELPCDIWILGGVPSPGHTFWMTGDANVTIQSAPSVTLEQALDEEISLAPVAPRAEVRGARLDRSGLELLVYDRTMALGGNSGRRKPSPSKTAIPPEDTIEAMMMSLIRQGSTRDEAAKRIREKPGFEAVTNEHARRVVANKLPRGRPKKVRS